MGNGARLRELIERDEILVVPGVYDPLTARAADTIGFDALYMTGYGTSLSKTGYPDAGLITMDEMLSNATNVQEHSSVPVIADADNGYGNATNVVRTIREYIRTGVGGVHIEDQVFPKRCGLVAGKEVVPVEEAIGKIEAACDVRDERDPEFVIIGRTDVPEAVGGSLEEGIERVNAYCEAGADMALIEGATSDDDLRRMGREVDAPLMYSYAAGPRPDVAPDRLQEWGFDVVNYPNLSTLAGIHGAYSRLRAFDRRGSEAVNELKADVDDLPVEGLHEFSGFPEVVEWEEQYLPEEDSEKYDESAGGYRPGE